MGERKASIPRKGIKGSKVKKKNIKKELAVLLARTGTKKTVRALHSSRRVTSGLNTGTRTHKSDKDYSRKYAIDFD